jgi:hypothetical protein
LRWPWTGCALDVALIPVAGQPEGPVRLVIHGNVVRAFEADHEVALELVAAVTAGIRPGFDGKSHLLTGSPKGGDVADLGLDGGEVGHGSPVLWPWPVA